MSFSRQVFIGFWPDGYRADNGMGDMLSANCIQPFADKDKVCLEIGCGGGFWLDYLVRSFGRVIAIDVIPKPEKVNVEYHELADRDYTCQPIADASIDFVWCFDVFCHLPNSAVSEYTANVWRVLKPGGEAVLTFANWPNHSGLKAIEYDESYREDAHHQGWFYMDKVTALKIFAGAGFECRDLLPDFRDSVLYGKKSELSLASYKAH